MMSSLFDRLYKYKQTDQRHQKENFLTEIFAHCLRTDVYFRKNFLNRIGCKVDCLDFNCETQFSDKEFGRPDIFIKLDNHTAIVIECKVDSTQQETQLNRYASFLKKHETVNKHLVFLTKFYEETTEFESDPNFQHIRWHEIFELLKGSSNELSKELANYLIEQRMSNIISFTNSDVMAISFINETIKKMDGFLSRLADILNRYSDNKVHYDKINNLLIWSTYGIITDYKEGQVWLGFYQYEHNEEMQICIDFTVPLTSKYLENIGKVLELNNWDGYDNEDGTREWFNSKNLSFFIKDDIFQTNDACNFIEAELQIIQEWR